MDVNQIKPQFHIPSEPSPVPSLRDIVSLATSPEESFVIIKSSAELNSMSDDNDVLQDASILSENKRLIEEELRDSETKYADLYLKRQTPDDTDLEDKSDTKSFRNGFHCSSNHNESSFMPQPHLPFNSIEVLGTVRFSRNDFCSQEIEQRVAQLIMQNKQMKDTIIQNSKTMENQKEKIVLWQEKSKEVHEAHREKLLEAKNVIDSLQKEKVALKAKIASLEAENERLNTLVQQTMVHDETKLLLENTIEKNMKQSTELDIANKKIKELEASLSQLTLTNQKEQTAVATEDALNKAQITIAQLERQLKEAEIKKNEALSDEATSNELLFEKISHYDRELEGCYKKIKALNEQIDTRQRVDVEELNVLKEKLFASEMANDRMRDEITSLRTHLARAMSTDIASKLQLELNNALSERERMTAELDARNSQILDMNNQLKDMEHQLLQAKANVQYDLQGILEREEQAKVETWRAQQRIAELEQNLLLVQKNLEAKAQQVLTQQSDPGELAYIRQHLVQSQLELKDAVQKRAVAEAQLTMARNEVERLSREMESKGNADEIFALKSQLEVFRLDFDAEKKAKEEEKARSSKMSEDLQQLHRRNQQLQEEVEILRAQIPGGPRAPSRSSGGSNSQTSNQRNAYKCPKCNFAFDDLRAAEVHINRCLDLEESLP